MLQEKIERYENHHICTGFDVPTDPLTADDIAFWTGSPHYQPWKDVTDFFRDEKE